MFKRHLRVNYWNSEPRILAPSKAALEQSLKQLGTVDLSEIKTLDEAEAKPCDLLIIPADHIPQEHFVDWLKGLRLRIKQQRQIWTPALIMADVEFSDLNDLLEDAIQANWYFDVMHRDHLDSLPIRVANLLRMHDHLHELKRYRQELDALDRKVADLEAKVPAKR